MAFLLCVQLANASHVMGFFTEMECLNACTTRVHFRAYRDCSGATGISNSLSFNPTTAGCLPPTPVGSASTQVYFEVTPICASVPTQCSSASATFVGVQEYASYQDYDVCGLTGCSYTLGWTSCCRNAAITSGASNQSSTLQNTVVLQAGCNNSPTFTNLPIFYGCAGASYAVHQGAYDPDGDSLAYALGTCLGAAGAPVTYNPGYSPTQPLGSSWNVTIDPITGMLNLVANPGIVQVGVLCIVVSEYRNGVLIGTSTRDMQIQIGNFCAGNSAPIIGPITNITGNATLVGPSTISVCPGTSFCFDISATDADTVNLQTVSLYWDGNIAGATFTEAGFPAVVDTVRDSTPVGRFCWTATTPGTYQFLVSAEDNYCGLIVPQDQLITIQVANGGPANLITATGTFQACAGSADTLSAPAGYASYLWSSNNTAPTIAVNIPGTYSVTVTNANGCAYWDSYTVASLPPDISGTITDHVGNPLAGQKVYLIDHDPALASLSAADSTLTDAAGYYEFCTVTLDTAYIKAAPDSAAYPTDMPTYYSGNLMWAAATPVPAVNLPVTANFATLFGSNPGGPGFIGGLLTQGANKTLAPGDPIPGMTMWLYSSTLSQPIDHTVTDGNGYFFFGNLPLGDYFVLADKPGVSTTNVPSLTLDLQNVVRDSLDFRLHTTYLELVLNTVAVTPQRPGFALDISPNPMGETGLLHATLSEETDLRFAIHDLRGRQLYATASMHLPAGKHQFRLNPGQWGISAGTYFVRVQAGTCMTTLKIVVQ
jgi:Carboxypeptidase regulatory-like domain